LLRLYPRAWRERYGDEWLALVEHRSLSLRVVIDVVLAAGRERAAAIVPSLCKLAGVYVLGWLCLLMLRTMLPREVTTLNVFSLADHGRMLVVFLAAALVTRTIELALRGAGRMPETKGSAMLADLAIYVAALLGAYAWRIVAPGLALTSVTAPVVVIAGKYLGHTPGMNRALFLTWRIAPRPPSLTRLRISQ
jgi:hypothetical protein